MQGTYTVTKAQQARSYQSKYGDMVVWQVRLDSATTESTDGIFELHKKPGNEPKPGDTIEVERTQEGEFDGNPFVRLYLAKPPQGGGFSDGGQSRSDDKRGESIERQVAAKVAGEMAVTTPDPGGVGAVLVISNFEAYFDAVLAKIKGGPQQSLNGGGGEVPADMQGLASSPATSDEQIPF